MADKEETPIKIKRSRRRLYDPLVQESEERSQDSEAGSQNPEFRSQPEAPLSEVVAAEDTPESPSDSGAMLCVSSETEPDDSSEERKLEKSIYAKEIIHKYVRWSAGVALIPLPLADVVAVSAIQLKMLKKLCEVYEIKFSEHLGKAMIGSLIGGVNVGLMSASLLKVVPVFGLPVSISSAIVVAGAITYAVGVVFVYHFEKGGTLSDFNPSEHKENLVSAYKEAEKQL